MPRSRRSKKTRSSNNNANGEEEKQQIQNEEMSKICEPGVNSKSANKKAKSRKSRKKRTSETKTEIGRGNDTDPARVPSMINKSESICSKDDALRKTAALSSYKIPKKKVDGSKNSATIPKVQPVRTGESISLSTTNRSVHHTLNEDERKRKSEDPDSTYPVSQKRCPSVRAAENAVNGPRSISKTQIHENRPTSKTQIHDNSTLTACSTDSRPKISAKRRIPTSGGLAQNAVIDTPQMAMLKKQIASRNTVNKGKEKATNKHNDEHKKMKAGVNVPISPSYQTSTTNRDEIRAFEIGASAPGDTATFEVPDVLELVRNGYCNAEMDTTDAMDVDVVQSVLPSSKYKQLVIIVDTNVWIGNQDLIKEILSMDFPSSLPATLILPWMVLQEIDHKKNSGSATMFRNASKFIYDLLSKKHPRVRAQKATEAFIGMEFNELMADDSILNCAIQYNKLSQINAVLVTNDINLLNKALVHGLTACKADQGLVPTLRKLQSEDDSQIINNELDVSTVSTDTTISHSFLTTTSSFSTPSTSHCTLNSGVEVFDCMEDIVMDVDDPMGVEESNYSVVSNNNDGQHLVPDNSDPPTFESVATALQQTLTSIIVPKMVEEYGKDEWRFAIKVKPPFTVESGMKCLQAHWIAVFSYLFPSRGKEVIDESVRLFQQKHGHANALEIKTWRLNVCQMAKVLLTLNNEISSGARVSDCCRLLQEYIQFETKQMQS